MSEEQRHKAQSKQESEETVVFKNAEIRVTASHDDPRVVVQQGKTISKLTSKWYFQATTSSHREVSCKSSALWSCEHLCSVGREGLEINLPGPPHPCEVGRTARAGQEAQKRPPHPWEEICPVRTGQMAQKNSLTRP